MSGALCEGDSVRWTESGVECRGVLQTLDGARAKVLSNEGRTVVVAVAKLSLAPEASGVFDVTRT